MLYLNVRFGFNFKLNGFYLVVVVFLKGIDTEVKNLVWFHLMDAHLSSYTKQKNFDLFYQVNLLTIQHKSNMNNVVNIKVFEKSKDGTLQLWDT